LTFRLSPITLSIFSSQQKPQRCYVSQSRQLKNEGEKNFPRKARTDRRYAPLHTAFATARTTQKMLPTGLRSTYICTYVRNHCKPAPGTWEELQQRERADSRHRIEEWRLQWMPLSVFTNRILTCGWYEQWRQQLSTCRYWVLLALIYVPRNLAISNFRILRNREIACQSRDCAIGLRNLGIAQYVWAINQSINHSKKPTRSTSTQQTETVCTQENK